MHRLSYVSSPYSTPPNYCSIIDKFRQNVTRSPNKEICIERGVNGTRRAITNAELDARSNQVAKYIIHSGIKKGDNITLFGPNTVEWMVAEIAILKSGAVSVHTTVNVKNSKDIKKALMDVDCKFLILDPGQTNEYKVIVNMILSSAKEANMSLPVLLLRSIDEYTEYPRLIDIEGMDRVADFPVLYPEDPAVIYPTSGTTGEPKLAQHSHYNCINYTFLPPEKTDEDDIFFNDRPFSWAGGFAVPHICNNQTRVFVNATLALKGQSTEKLWQVIESEKCTHALLLTYFLHDLIHLSHTMKDYGFRLNSITTGGELIESHYTQVLGRYCKEFRIGYGSTEAGLISTLTLKPGDYLLSGNLGNPEPGYEIRTISDDSYPTLCGQAGRLNIRSTQMFNGYYNNEEMTKEVMSKSGWFDIGDVGVITAEGLIVFKGRTKEMISRGGRKIYPSTIENVISEMKGIEAVVVVPVPDERLFEEICVCYIPDDDPGLSPSDVEEYCKQLFVADESYDGLGDMPKYFIKYSQFPQTATGKVHKTKLAEESAIRLKIQKQ